ncbi:phage tail assembly chaperone [Clostridium novyi]
MNAVEMLLKKDLGKLEIPAREVKMKLAKLKGEEITFNVKAIDPEIMSEIQEKSLEIMDGDVQIVNTFKVKALMIVESCADIFKNKEVQAHFNAPTPIDLMKKLMLNGEIDDLDKVVQEVNGYESKKKKKS